MNNLIKTLFTVVAFSMISLATAAPRPVISIGGKGYTESLLIVEITKQYLESKGYDVTAKTGLGTAVVRKALVNGQLDLYWEYTGPALVNFFKKPGVPRDEMVGVLNQLDVGNGIKWLESSGVNNTYAIAMNKDTAKELGIKNMSDLSRALKEGKKIRFACNAEFYARQDGLKPMEEFYDIKFPRDDIIRMDSGLTYNALKDRNVEAALVFSTDGRIPSFNFMLIEDEKNYHIPQVMTPVVRIEYLSKHPNIEALMKDISSRLDSESISALNAAIDVDKKPISTVARDFLAENKLI